MSSIDTGLHYPIELDILPTSWTFGLVGEFCDVIQSGFACGKHSDDDIGVTHLRPMNVSREGLIDLTVQKYVPSSYDDRRLAAGNVLFNNTNSPELIGKTAYVTNEADGLAFSNHMTRIGFSSSIDAKYGAYQLHYLWMSRYYMHKCVKHVNQASISSRDFSKSIPFVVPPTNEQHRIVAKIGELFSELDKGIESLKTAREQLKVYRQALLKHAFEGKLTEQWRKDNADKLEAADQLLERIKQEREARYQQQLEKWKAAVKQWEAGGKEGKKPVKPKKLPELKHKGHDQSASESLPGSWIETYIDSFWALYKKPMTTGPFGTALRKSEHKSEGEPVLGIENIGKGVFVSGNKIFVDKLKAEELSSFVIESGDLIISRSGTVGEICEVPNAYDGSLISTNLIRVSLNRKVMLPGYFVYLFQGEGMVMQQVRELCKGSSRDFLNQTILKDILFPVPSITEQEEIVVLLNQYLSVSDQLDSEIIDNLNRTQALRQSILKKAFSGQLVPQDPADEPASVLLDRIAKEKEQAAAKAKQAKAAKKKTKQGGAA